MTAVLQIAFLLAAVKAGLQRKLVSRLFNRLLVVEDQPAALGSLERLLLSLVAPNKAFVNRR